MGKFDVYQWYHIEIAKESYSYMCKCWLLWSHRSSFFSFKTLKVKDIHILQNALFMFRFNTNSLPRSFENMFHLNAEVHSYPTRQATDVHLCNPKTLLAHKSVRHTGPDIWNKLPSELCNIKSIYSFKKAVKNMLITQYQHDQWCSLQKPYPIHSLSLAFIVCSWDSAHTGCTCLCPFRTPPMVFVSDIYHCCYVGQVTLFYTPW